MYKMLKAFIKEEDGLGTVEIIIIIAVLVGIALLFRKQIINFVNGIIDKLFPSADQLENNKAPQPKLKN